MNLIMGSLAKKSPDDGNWKTFGNITGYNGLDIYASTIERSRYGYPEINGGIYPRIVQIFGPSTTGKTTLGLKIMGAIVSRWRHYFQTDMSEAVDFDIEENTPPERICSLLGWSEPELMERLEYIPGAKTTALEIYNKVRYIAGLKEKNRDSLMVDTGLLDVDGSPIKIFPPTPILLDSLAVLNPEGIDELEYDREGMVKDLKAMTNNMEGARDSKSNTAFIKKVKPFLDKYNIILLIINHLTQEIQTNLYEAPKKHLAFLKPGEKLKGGNEGVYQSYTILGLNPGEKITDKDPFYGDQIYGSKVWFSYVKNKNGMEGVRFPMIFDSKKGFLPELSDWEYLYENSYGFSGSPARYYLEVLPEITFTKRNLFESCRTNGLLARAMSFTTRMRMMAVNFGQPIPDLRGVASKFSLEYRVAMIMGSTEPYPGYEGVPIDYSAVGLEYFYPQAGFYMDDVAPRQYFLNDIFDFDQSSEEGCETVPYKTPAYDLYFYPEGEDAEFFHSASLDPLT